MAGEPFEGLVGLAGFAEPDCFGRTGAASSSLVAGSVRELQVWARHGVS